MQFDNLSQQFSFWSQQASQGSNPRVNPKSKAYRERNKVGQNGRSSQYADTKTSTKYERKRLAGIKSREKKKNYVKTMEENVKRLDLQIEEIDKEITKCKESLTEAIRTSNNNSNEHAFTFAELERNALAEDPDLDRINLLIDLIRNRIGANGKERQAKLDYNFKQIIDSMFTPTFRYLLISAYNQTDIFAPGASIKYLQANKKTWIHEFYQQSALEDWQIQAIAAFRQKFCQHRQEAINQMRRLKAANEKIKRQGEIFQNRLGYLRQDMNPIQCAQLTLFAQKNKLRRQFAFGDDFQGPSPARKKLKTE